MFKPFGDFQVEDVIEVRAPGLYTRGYVKQVREGTLVIQPMKRGREHVKPETTSMFEKPRFKTEDMADRTITVERAYVQAL